MTGPAVSKQHWVTPGTQTSAPQIRLPSALASITSTNSQVPVGGPPQQPAMGVVIVATSAAPEPNPTSDATQRVTRAMLVFMRRDCAATGVVAAIGQGGAIERPAKHASSQRPNEPKMMTPTSTPIRTVLAYAHAHAHVRAVPSSVLVVIVVAGAAVIAAAAAAGCGEVRFIDTPFAPRQITVAYSIQEDVTVVRWHIGAEKPSSEARFEMLGQDQVWRPVDFSASVFAGGLAPCGGGHGMCAQLVLAGRYTPPEAQTILRSFHPDYGVSPGDAASMRTNPKTLLVEARFERGNGVLATTISDLIGGDAIHRFPRPLERGVWERRTVCVTGFHPADASFEPTGAAGPQKWPAPKVLSADGRYCAGARAIASDGAPGVDESIAVDTLPAITTGNHLYTAPTELTPFSYKIVLDLSIPVADRCLEAMQLIEQTVGQVLGAASSVRRLPTVDLSTQREDPLQPMACHQYFLRQLDAVDLAQEVKREAASWPEKHQRFFLLYFNNLRAFLPPALTGSFDAFSAAIGSTLPPDVDFRAEIWGFAPEETLGSYVGWGFFFPWLSASDESFRQQLIGYATNRLPLISEIHDAARPIPILPEGDAARLAGGRIRLCEVSVTPAEETGLQPIHHDEAGDVVPLPRGTRDWTVAASDPPAYILDLPPVEAVPKPGFTPHEARIRYEICTQYCDHGFIAESGAPIPEGWTSTSLCMGPP